VEVNIHAFLTTATGGSNEIHAPDVLFPVAGFQRKFRRTNVLSVVLFMYATESPVVARLLKDVFGRRRRFMVYTRLVKK
jgi:hypothetical protein